MKPIDDIVIPSHTLKIRKEANEPNKNPNSNSLSKLISIINNYPDQTYRNTDQDPNSDAGRDRQGSLSIVLSREQPWILHSSMSADESQLRTSEDGIGIEIGHVGLDLGNALLNLPFC